MLWPRERTIFYNWSCDALQACEVGHRQPFQSAICWPAVSGTCDWRCMTNPHNDSFLIRSPAPAEKRACRMLLPLATTTGQPVRLHVAAGTHDQHIIGAAALGPDLGSGTYSAVTHNVGRRWLVDLRVILPFRGKGVGRALLQRVTEQAMQHGIAALHAWQWMEPQSEAARAWSALGFSACQRRFDFEADLSQAHATLLPLYARAREENWIPPAAQIISLADADHDAVAQLHVQCLGGTRRLLMSLLRGSAPDAYDPICSRVLLLDRQVVGFTLGRVHADGVCDIDANVIHSSVRRSWANLWLKFEAARFLLARGVHTIRYATFQQHTDTQRVSRQVGARLLRTMVQMRRELASAATTPPTRSPASAPLPPPPPAIPTAAEAGG